MRKWECTVCGYIHEGDEPPEECPVCGADRSKFIEITEKDQGPTEAKPHETPPAEKDNSSSRALPEDKPPAKPKTKPAPGPLRNQTIADLLEKYKTITDQMARYHAHPISVHIPNGVLPVSVFFLLLGLLFDSMGLEAAAFYNLVFVVLAMPVVFFTGYVDWQTQYRGAMTRIFKTKMICAVIVFILGFMLMFWRLLDPGVSSPQSGYRWIYFLVELMMLGAAGVAGYMGGKLVFKKK